MQCKLLLDVPEALAKKLPQLGDRLPEALEQMLHDFRVDEMDVGADEQQIIELLASQPTPEAVLAIRPSGVL